VPVRSLAKDMVCAGTGHFDYVNRTPVGEAWQDYFPLPTIETLGSEAS
jgi:hypothetical protein